MISWIRTYYKVFKEFKIAQKIAILVIITFIFVGILSNILANNKPIICKYQDEIYLPVFRDQNLRSKLLSQQEIVSFKDIDFQWSLWPIIRYRSSDIDEMNAGCVGPFDTQKLSHNGGRHYLGTDELGRDIAAGLIHGARIAFLVSIGVSIISFIIGVLFGLLGGYFGDHSLRISHWKLWLSIVILFLTGFWFFYSLQQVILSIFIQFSLWVIVNILAIIGLRLIDTNTKWAISQYKVDLPIDFLLQRFLEIFKSIPGFFIILIALIIISSPSIINIIFIIGILRWPTIAQHIRGETLRIKQMNYVKNAQLNGHPSYNIIRHHILPSVLTSVIIYIAFGMGTAILIESTISFLGLGLGTEHFTWGAMLSESRKYFYAWWLAIFPGMAIFSVVFSFNILGELLLDRLDPKRRSI